MNLGASLGGGAIFDLLVFYLFTSIITKYFLLEEEEQEVVSHQLLNIKYITVTCNDMTSVHCVD